LEQVTSFPGYKHWKWLLSILFIHFSYKFDFFDEIFAYFDQMSWNLVCWFLSCAWIWNRRHFGFRRARSYAKLIFALILTKWAEIWYVGSLAVPEYGTDVILDFEGLEATPNSFLLYFDQMSWNLVCRFLSCAWIWNRRHFGFRGARSYAKLIFALILTKWAEIWYVGSLGVSEYGTEAILDFEGLEATPNSFLL